MTTGERLRARRKELGISANDIAEALGVSRATIFRYEKGDIEKLPGSILEPLSKILHTTPAYLMGWESESPEKQGVFERTTDQLSSGYSASQLTTDKALSRAIDQYYTLSEREQKLVLDLIDALAQNK